MTRMQRIFADLPFGLSVKIRSIRVIRVPLTRYLAVWLRPEAALCSLRLCCEATLL
jgi:hypothetical protein